MGTSGNTSSRGSSSNIFNLLHQSFNLRRRLLNPHTTHISRKLEHISSRTFLRLLHTTQDLLRCSTRRKHRLCRPSSRNSPQRSSRNSRKIGIITATCTSLRLSTYLRPNVNDSMDLTGARPHLRLSFISRLPLCSSNLQQGL